VTIDEIFCLFVFWQNVCYKFLSEAIFKQIYIFSMNKERKSEEHKKISNMNELHL